MSTLEATISMLEALPEYEVKVIHDFTRSIFSRTLSPHKPLTKAQILHDLEISRAQIEKGEYSDLEDAIDEIEAKYGL